MQAWLNDGFLPPSLPLRRHEDTDMITLQSLQASSTDPENPFQPPLIPQSIVTTISNITPVVASSSAQPQIPIPEHLLPPISLLAQPKRFGPPALFYSTRGGHSTTIVDARGRSVLKGKVLWTVDKQGGAPDSTFVGLGDVKRVEAFDTKDRRAVVVALRQGGIEAVDMGDALLLPGDESRTFLPLFTAPPATTNRRRNFVWRLGTPVEDVSTTLSPLGIQPRKQTSLGGGKKGSSKRMGSTKAPPSGEEPGSTVVAPDDDVIFLGRNEDAVYMCERNADTFRILRLTAEL